ncbi:MAG: non-canonical purine NTP pyrophosphatase, partial [Oscillospiraceae bacterium]|nr:non-canonical purine NTP pyrophosphatase [Oscillospiraceae bacterium]
APGVYSARYGGAACQSDAERTALLLRKLSGAKNRRASFVSCIACVFPNGDVLTAKGECAGELAYTPRGTGGFGYDPVFLFPETGKTMAELSPEEKNAVSHRGKALALFKVKLQAYKPGVILPEKEKRQ